MDTWNKVKRVLSSIRGEIVIRGHDLNCWIFQFRAKRIEDQFKREHPNYCRACGGWGGGMNMGGYWTPPDMWECPKCVEHGICPHCANDLNMEHPENDIQCPECGWNFENTDGLPGGYDCGCWQIHGEQL